MQETQVQSLSREDPLEKKKEMATHSYSCLENPMNRGAWRATVTKGREVTKSQIRLTNSNTHTHTQNFVMVQIRSDAGWD